MFDGDVEEGLLKYNEDVKKKGKNEVARKWLKHLIIAYLLASWGVNGVVIRCITIEMRGCGKSL